MADVPLLCYITIALEDKEYLEVEDILIIFGFFGMIVFGYVMNLTTGYLHPPSSVCLSVLSISHVYQPIVTPNQPNLFLTLPADIPTAIFFLILSSACIASSYYLAQDASREIEVKTQVNLLSHNTTHTTP